MLNAVVSFAVYFFEMLISYLVFSLIGDQKQPPLFSLLLGLLIYESGALLNLVCSNTVWVNLLYTFVMNFAFSVLCFHIKYKSAVIYAVLMNVFSVAFEFATIFAVSALTGNELTGYNSDISLLLMEAVISKTLYLVACISMCAVQKNAIERFPYSFYFYPIGTLLALITFWYICANERISHINQFLLSFVSVILFLLTVLLFITYRRNSEKEVEYIRVKSEFNRLQTEKVYYDILEHQNHQLMLYAHDAKNHLAAIQGLNDNSRINEYIEKLRDQLGKHTRSCQSGNMVLDVIINKYATECDMLGVVFEYDIKTCNLSNVDDLDLVAILGNLMDNALTSAQKSELKHVSLETTTRNSYNVIVIKNSCDNVPKTQGMNLLTTREDRKLHGFGLKSVRQTLKKYHGDYAWDYNVNTHCFVSTVMIEKMLQN